MPTDPSATSDACDQGADRLDGPLENLTVIVPTRGDAACLSLGVGAALDRGARLLILNNGSHSVLSQPLRFYGSRVRELIQPGRFAQQLAEAHHSVTTDFSILVDDDQYLSTPAAARGVQLLNSNQQVRFAFGTNLALEQTTDGYRLVANPTELLWRDPIRRSSRPELRLRDLARCWRSGTWYSVMRRDFLEATMSLATEARAIASSPSATEVAVETLGRSVASISIGRTVLQVRSLVRPSHQLPFHNSTLSYHQWRSTASYGDEVQAFDAVVCNAVKSVDSGTVEKVLQLVADDRQGLADRSLLQLKRLENLAGRAGLRLHVPNLSLASVTPSLTGREEVARLDAWARAIIQRYG